MSVGCAEEGDCVLFRAGNGDGSQQSVAVCQRWRTVDWHDAGDFQSDLAEIVDVARRLKSKKNKRKKKNVGVLVSRQNKQEMIIIIIKSNKYKY